MPSSSVKPSVKQSAMPSSSVMPTKKRGRIWYQGFKRAINHAIIFSHAIILSHAFEENYRRNQRTNVLSQSNDINYAVNHAIVPSPTYEENADNEENSRHQKNLDQLELDVGLGYAVL